MIPAYFDRYKTKRVLHWGEYATVALAVDEQTNEEVALKIMERQKIQEAGMMKYIESEIRILERVKHEAFVNIHKIIYDEMFIVIVMDYLENGCMSDLITNDCFLSQKDKLLTCITMLEGLDYLHKRGIAHRDVKPDNICFDKENNPKLLDFGFITDTCEISRTLCGTLIYMAPEVCQHQQYDAMKADVWSFGVTAHVILTYKFPFEDSNSIRHMHALKSGEVKIHNSVAGKMKAVIQSCLEIDPEKRPTCEELLKSFNEYSHELYAELEARPRRAVKQCKSRPFMNIHRTSGQQLKCIGQSVVSFKFNRALSV